jgi:hypothetical protein
MTTLNILGYEYDVIREKTVEELGFCGQIDSNGQLIHIATDMTIQQLVSTILHEILEALNYHMCLGLDHDTVSRLETGLYQTLTSNGVNIDLLASGLISIRARLRLEDPEA